MEGRRVYEYIIEIIGIAIFLIIIGITGKELINDPFISSNTKYFIKYFIKYTMGISGIMSILYAIIRGMRI